MRPSKYHTDCSRGFTLMELLISLTILAVVTVLVFSAFRVSIRAWEKGEQGIQDQQRFRIVLDMIKRQMTSICWLPLTDDGKTPWWLTGTQFQVSFLSHMAIFPENGYGLTHVKYVIDSDDSGNYQLRVYEQIAHLSTNDPDSQQEGNMLDSGLDSFQQSTELLSGFHMMAIEYLKEKSVDQGLVWQPMWDPKIEKRFPEAVRIRFQPQSDSPPVQLIAHTSQSTKK